MQTISRSRILTEALSFPPPRPLARTASFKWPFPKGVVGFPVGHGDTEESAMADLLERTNRESGLDLALIGTAGFAPGCQHPASGRRNIDFLNH